MRRVRRLLCQALQELQHEPRDEPGVDCRHGVEWFCLREDLLDARRAYEVAKRDGLTGLYNERYLHLRLTQELYPYAAGGALTYMKPGQAIFGASSATTAGLGVTAIAQTPR